MANTLRKEISDEVKKAEYFALMVDESKDMSRKEQISIVKSSQVIFIYIARLKTTLVDPKCFPI